MTEIVRSSTPIQDKTASDVSVFRSKYLGVFTLVSPIDLKNPWASPMDEHPFKHEGKWFFSPHKFVTEFLKKSENRTQLYEAVTDMLYSKFSRSRYLQHRLLATGSSLIVYADPEDNILGIGLSADQRESNNPSLWKGPNIYGLALMDLRNYLRESWKEENLEMKDGLCVKKDKKRKIDAVDE